MIFNLLLVSAAVLLNSSTVWATAGTPCESVSSMSSAFVSIYPSATIALVPVKAAADCLKSVPVQKSEDLALIEEMKNYIGWQSNLAYLSNPPAEYTEGRLDVMGTISKIEDDLKNGKYADEYTLQFDLSMAITMGYDFHFAWSPDILSVFEFRRGNIGRGLLDEFALISISKDGKELPKLYNYYDIIVGEEEGWTPSPVSEINDQKAEDYIQNWSKTMTFHEDHARYNRLFPNQAGISMGDRVNQFGRSSIPDGDYTKIKHENGTTRQYINNAIIALDQFDGVTDGASFYTQFCNLGPPQTNQKKRALGHELIVPRSNPTVPRQAVASATGYPKPQMLHPEAVIGGYYLTGKGYDDVAVLSVPSFSPSTETGPQDFQDLIGTFTKSAKAAGKTRLVIDLRANGGGRVFLGYDMFKQLFPTEDPFGATRFRANEAFDQVGLWMTDALKGFTYEEAVKDFEANNLNSTLGMAWKSIFNYQLPLTVDNKNFTSWQEYFGPHLLNNDNFTTPARLDLNNFFSDDVTLDVTGYRTRANKLNMDQPFAADKIVMLTDGACGSTCAVFSEFMKFQGGVQQIVVGGKPEKGYMQGVAGSKGAQVYTFDQVLNEATVAYTNLPDQQEELNKTAMGQLVFSERPLMRSAYQSTGMAASVINLKDNIRQGDKTNTPLEFVYEAADCRLFYTADMIQDVTATWKKAVDARWGDTKSTCVDGSTGHKSSLSGGALKKDKKSSATKTGGTMTAIIVGLAGVMIML